MIMSTGAAPFTTCQDSTEELVSFVRDFFGGNMKKRRDKAIRKIVPVIVKHSVLKGLDPLLVATIISRESSFKQNAIGKMGEVGLMQVRSHEPMKGHDMRTIDGQIGAGTTLLKFYMKKCDTAQEALNAYLSGGCNPVLPQTKDRYQSYERAVRLHRTDFSDWAEDAHND